MGIFLQKKSILLYGKEYAVMEELKTDLFPANLYRARNEEKQKNEQETKSTIKTVEPLPESERPRKDGPGGE